MSRQPLDPSRRAPGFTLVELLIVVVLISLLAATVVPTLANRDNEARIAAAQNVVRSIARQIERYRAQHDEWPPQIQADWFRGYRLPTNPLVPDHPRNAQSDNDRSSNAADKWHPNTKTTVRHPFWYNTANGTVRIRVPAQDTDKATLALYNLVNGTNARSLADNNK